MSTYTLELAITHIVLIGAYWIFLRKEGQYDKMRFFLIASTMLSIVIPLFRLPKLFSSSHQPFETVPMEAVTVVDPTIVVAPETSFFNFELMMWCSLFISCILLLKLVARIVYIIKLKRSSIAEFCEGLDIRRMSNLKGSFTFFNWIFIGDDIVKGQKEYAAILAHEKAHVRLRHSYDIVFLEVFKAFFWWLPSSWYINKEIKRVHEYQADAHALRSCHIDLYSTVLINSTLQANGLSLASSFHDGLIFKRLKAMKQQTKKVKGWKLGLLSMLSIILFVTLACSEEKSSQASITEKSVQTEAQRELFTIVEAHPTYEGGFDAFYKYVMSEIRYPAQARNAGIEGTVKVQFDIERDGSISNAKALNSLGKAVDQEAIRVITKAPGFKAGTQRGRTVSSTMMMPITFKLDQSKRNPDNSAQGAIVAGEVAPKNKQFIGNIVYNHSKGVWSGSVVGEDGKSVPGTNVVVVGTNYGTVTDLDGSFSLKATKDQQIELSRVGYDNLRIENKR